MSKLSARDRQYLKTALICVGLYVATKVVIDHLPVNTED